MKTMRWTSVLLFGLVSGFLVRPAIAATDGTRWKWGGNWNAADYWVGGIWPKDGGIARIDIPNQYPAGHATWAISVNVPTTLRAFDFGGFGITIKGDNDIQYVGANPYINNTFMRKANNANATERFPADYCLRTHNYNKQIKGTGENKLTLKGRGEILVKQPIVDFKEVEIRDVLMTTNPASFALTACDTKLSGRLFYWPCGTGDATVSLAKGKTLTLEAGAGVTIRNTTQTRTATVELGTLARGLKGTFVVADMSGTLGDKEKVKASGDVLTPYEDILEPWMVGYNANNKIHFLTYDATDGFKPVAHTTTDLTNAGEDDIVLVNANVTLSANKKIRALIVEDQAVLTIANGVTLTVGDDPGHAAAVVLNVKSGSGYTVLSGGAIDFGRSPGFVWLATQDETSDVRIETLFKGTAGVTLAGASSTVDVRNYPYIRRDSNFNFCGWTGGTALVGIHLGVRTDKELTLKVNPFENSGELYVVSGDVAGGTVFDFNVPSTVTYSYDGKTTFDDPILFGKALIGNRVYVSGMGKQWKLSSGQGEACDITAGAFLQSETTLRQIFTNRVTLVGDARFEAYGNSKAGYEFYRPIDGAGDFHLRQTEAFTYFDATNTYCGRTIQTLSGGGALGLKGCGTFGNGPVSLEGNLLFEDTIGTTVVTNEITCAGGAELVRANVKLDGKTAVAGTVANFGYSSLTIGPDVRFGAIDATSTLAVTGATDQSALVLTGDDDSHLSNTLSPGLRIVKGGSGVLTFHTADGGRGQTGAPKVEVKGGTVAFENDLFKSRGLVYWLDASDPMTFETDALKGNVMKWNSKNGNGYSFAAPTKADGYAYDGYGAQTGVNTVNGKNVLTFVPGSDTRNGLVGSRAVSQRTMILVVVPRQTQKNQALFGTTADYSFRTSSDDYQKWRVVQTRTSYESSGGIYLNGQWTTDGAYTTDAPQILTVRHPVDVVAEQPPAPVFYRGRDYERMQLGFQYSDVRTPGGYNGDIAEVLAFDTILTDDERKTVENYLAKKWGISNQLHADVAARSEQVLDPATTVSLDADATLDLNGHSQTIASLSGFGKIINSAGGEAPVLTITGACDFRGVAEGVTLRLAGGARFGAYGSGIPTNGILYRLDASRPETLVTNEQGVVSRWNSRGALGTSFEWNASRKLNDATNGPTYQASCEAFGGRPGLYFAQKCQLRAVANTLTKTVFMVTRFDAPYVNEYFPWCSRAADGGLRAHISDTWGDNISMTYWTRYGNRVSVDGNPIIWGRNYSDKGTSYELHRMPAGAFLYGARLGEDRVLSADSDVLNEGGGKLGNGCWFGEVIAYDRCLTDDECEVVEAYLKNKWFGAGGIPVESDDVQVKGDIELAVGADGKIKPVVIDGTLDAADADLRVVNAKQGEKNAVQDLLSAAAVHNAFKSTSADYDAFDFRYLADQLKYVGKRLVKGLILMVR